MTPRHPPFNDYQIIKALKPRWPSAIELRSELAKPIRKDLQKLSVADLPRDSTDFPWMSKTGNQDVDKLFGTAMVQFARLPKVANLYRSFRKLVDDGKLNATRFAHEFGLSDESLLLRLLTSETVKQPLSLLNDLMAGREDIE